MWALEKNLFSIQERTFGVWHGKNLGNLPLRGERVFHGVLVFQLFSVAHVKNLLPEAPAEKLEMTNKPVTTIRKHWSSPRIWISWVLTTGPKQRKSQGNNEKSVFLTCSMCCSFFVGVSLDFCKGRIPPNTEQMSLKSTKIFCFPIFADLRYAFGRKI